MFKDCVLKHLETIIRQNDIIIKRLSMIHNAEDIKNQKPLAWLTDQEREELNDLKEKNPVLFDYITQVLKVFLGCK